MHRNPRQITWTVLYRRKHKKGTTEEVSKKRTRRNVKFQRSVQGATLENILAKRNQKPEVRKAQREQAIRLVLLPFNIETKTFKTLSLIKLWNHSYIVASQLCSSYFIFSLNILFLSASFLCCHFQILLVYPNVPSSPLERSLCPDFSYFLEWGIYFWQKQMKDKQKLMIQEKLLRGIRPHEVIVLR